MPKLPIQTIVFIDLCALLNAAVLNWWPLFALFFAHLVFGIYAARLE